MDSTVWIDYLRGVENAETFWLDGQLQRQRLGLLDLILCEVLRGIRDEGEFARVYRDLAAFEIFETGDTQLAVASARNCRKLQTRGCAVRSTMDCWIATFCLLGGHELLHRNRDFDGFEKFLGLRVVKA